MSETNKKRTRRPKALWFKGYHHPSAEVVPYSNQGHSIVFLYDTGFRGEKVRQLANWLTRAADYLEARHG